MIKEFIKGNRLIRSVYFIVKDLCDYFVCTKSFGKISKGSIINLPFHVIGKKNIEIGKDCGIGSNAYISAPNAKFICKDHCAIAEGLTVHTGNHVRIVGNYVTGIKEDVKPKGYDKDVIVENDVWIGANVTLLCGITIGRGATVAAGAVVASDIPPYCICGGIPAKPIKFYWSIDQIMEHESKLYPVEERFTKQQLETFFQSIDRNPK